MLNRQNPTTEVVTRYLKMFLATSFGHVNVNLDLSKRIVCLSDQRWISYQSTLRRCCSARLLLLSSSCHSTNATVILSVLKYSNTIKLREFTSVISYCLLAFHKPWKQINMPLTPLCAFYNQIWFISNYHLFSLYGKTWETIFEWGWVRRLHRVSTWFEIKSAWMGMTLPLTALFSLSGGVAVPLWAIAKCIPVSITEKDTNFKVI